MSHFHQTLQVRTFFSCFLTNEWEFCMPRIWGSSFCTSSKDSEYAKYTWFNYIRIESVNRVYMCYATKIFRVENSYTIFFFVTSSFDFSSFACLLVGLYFFFFLFHVSLRLKNALQVFFPSLSHSFSFVL